MAWTTPITWTPVLVNADNMNEQIRDNLNYLYDRPMDIDNVNLATNFSTTNTNFAPISNGTDTLQSDLLTLTGGIAVLELTATVALSTTMRVYFRVVVFEDDGVTPASVVGLDDGLCVLNGTTSDVNIVTLSVHVASLAAGDYYLRPQWKVNTGTATMYAGAGTTNFDLHPQLFAYELP